MFFSIIIPVYNAEKTIKRCLNSILEQEFEDFEVILVNDGSSDQSSLICQQYIKRDSRFKYIVQDNKGVSEARNLGIKAAEGEYLCFLDSDDVYHKCYLRIFFDVIHRHPDVDNYWCMYNCIELDRECIQKDYEIDFKNEISMWGKKTIMSLHEKALDGAPWNKIYKREIIISNDIRFDKNCSLGEDMMFNYDYLDKTKGEILLVELPLYGYYCGITNSLNNKYRCDLYEIYEKLDSHILKYLNKWQVSEVQKRKYYNSVFYRQENILRNTFRDENNSTLSQKYFYNSMIMKKRKFKEAIKYADCYIHPLYKIAYLSGEYRAVRVVDKIVCMKKR